MSVVYNLLVNRVLLSFNWLGRSQEIMGEVNEAANRLAVRIVMKDVGEE
jgi:hypothetical protein